MAFQGPAVAAPTTQVSIVEGAFIPATVALPLGGSVQWTNNGAERHTATSDGIDPCCPTGAALWDSGKLTGGGVGTFTFGFVAAGTYAYHCSIHTTMRGTVKVRGRAQPKSGGVTTSFRITWATSIPSGYDVNVQIKRPGSGFTDLLVGTTTLSTMFTPDAGTGTYQFRFQLHRSGSGTLLSGFSPPTTITVS
jgi:plastocyanin